MIAQTLSAAPTARVAARHRGTLAVFVATLVCAAAMLFIAEPMVGRLLLPRAGSTPAVWNTSLVFFQAALLCGYGYAHLSARWLGARTQVIAQVALLVVGAAVLPLRLPASWLAPADANLVLWQLVVMSAVVGLPFVMISATTPLLQHWFTATGHPLASDPYALYRASNLGSAVALIGYPLVIEPTLGLRDQGIVWSIGYGALLALTAACAVVMLRVRRRHDSPLETSTPVGIPIVDAPARAASVTWRRRTRWMATAALPSAWLLAVTTYLTTEIAPIPLLWVLPLGIYLLSFTAAFGTWHRLRQRHLMRVLPFALILLVGTLVMRASGPFYLIAIIHLFAFGLAALLCHRRLAEDRPAPKHLTDFYLSLSAGGLIGGAVVAIVAPVIFSSYAEYPLAVVLLCALLATPANARVRARWLDFALPVGLGLVTAGLALISTRSSFDLTQQRVLIFAVPAVIAFSFSRRPLRFGLGLGAIVLVTSLPVTAAEQQLYAARDYFGVHRVVVPDRSSLHVLFDGAIVHGAQSTDPAHRDDPLTYYTRSGPLGDVMTSSAVASVRSVGVIGLGAGSMACYARADQAWRFYEIDPTVVRIAEDRSLFTFLGDCLPGQPAVTLGDARLQLQRSAQTYDLLVTDAFGGDAIPTHLLTREAVLLDLGHLTAHGLLVFHISNQHADLSSVVANLAADRSLCAYQRVDGDVAAAHIEPGKFASQWVAMARSCADLGDLTGRPGWVPLPPHPEQRVWTDDYGAILDVVRWNS